MIQTLFLHLYNIKTFHENATSNMDGVSASPLSIEYEMAKKYSDGSKNLLTWK